MSRWEPPPHQLKGRLVSDELSALAKATAWINTTPLMRASLEGKVVLVQFWTFTCINWLRTLPYMRHWAQSYNTAGLVVIGIHTPEFSFEHDVANVRRATAEMKVEYPVAVDSDYGIWRGFNNRYWPALYLLDAKGRIRHHQFGEGGYADTERVIQQLLMERTSAPIPKQSSLVEGRGIEAEADWDDLLSSENYLGYERSEGLSSPGGAVVGRRRSYIIPRDLKLNQWALGGDWTVGKESIALNNPNGRIARCFHSRDLHLVMGPPAGASAIRFRVFLDGQPVTAAYGVDVDNHGNGVAKTQRLYQLVRQPKPIVDRVCQIEYLDSGLEAFSFTFG